MSLIEATWVGPSDFTLNGQVLEPGKTVVVMSKDEAQASDHWEVTGERAVRAPKQPEQPDPDSTTGPAPAEGPPVIIRNEE